MIPFVILAIESPDDRAFMEQLYLSYHRLMYSEIHKITNDPFNTEDIFQTSLIKLIEKIDKIKHLERDNLINYIISTCKNNAYNFCRKSKRISEFEYLDFDGVEYDGNALEDKIILDEQNDIFKRAWDMLDERSHYFLEARYILEKTDEEMARDLQIKPASVRMGLTRARKSLRKIMDELE